MAGPAGGRYRSAYDEIERLWAHYEAEIRAVSGKRTPWVETWLEEHDN